MDQVLSATFFASQVDFTFAGDLKVFIDEEQVSTLERKMQEHGFLDASKMATVFNMLRSNDLIWPYVINNYLKGTKPHAFDLLYWNADSTRMPVANHSFYLRNFYLDNKFARGDLELSGLQLDLRKVKIPIYNLATQEDHIAPAKSVLHGSKYFSAGRRSSCSPGPVISPALSIRPICINISTGPGLNRPARMLINGWPRPLNMQARGGRTGWTGSVPRIRARYRRAPSAAANSSRSRTLRART
jgi:hypothetical protein